MIWLELTEGNVFFTSDRIGGCVEEGVMLDEWGVMRLARVCRFKFRMPLFYRMGVKYVSSLFANLIMGIPEINPSLN